MVERTNVDIGWAERVVVCPNCGNRQEISAADQRCDRCGNLLNPTGSVKSDLPAVTTSAPSDPGQVPPSMASGGLGGVNDGTQVPLHPPTAVPGKPMAPIGADPARTSSDELRGDDTQGMDPGPGPTLRGSGAP